MLRSVSILISLIFVIRLAALSRWACVSFVCITVSFHAGYGQYKLQFKDDEPGTKPPKDDAWKLTVMHTNDTHAHLDNAARRMTKIKEIRIETDRSILRKMLRSVSILISLIFVIRLAALSRWACVSFVCITVSFHASSFGGFVPGSSSLNWSLYCP